VAIIVMMVVVPVVVAIILAALIANFLQFMTALLRLGTLLPMFPHCLLTVLLGPLNPSFAVAATVCMQRYNSAEQAPAQHKRNCSLSE
jgi:energy-coupling factor transporter transmembrane protein EcfT